jgi:hypothetical protein
MSDNLKLWKSVEKTDPIYTKSYSMGGGMNGTSISGAYYVMKATDAFGPIGLGWGYEIEEERFDKGEPIGAEVDGVTSIYKQTHTIKLRLWAKVNDERCEVVHFGHTPYLYKSRKGDFILDQEAPKKSLTDAIKKCLSMFGIGGDIFLGMFDDAQYVNEVKEDFAIEKSDDKVAAKLEAKKAYEDKKAQTIKLIETAQTMPMLESLYVEIIRKAKRQGDESGIMAVTKAKDKRKQELEK